MNDDDEPEVPDAVWWFAIAVIYGPIALCAWAWLAWDGRAPVVDAWGLGLGLWVGVGVALATQALSGAGPLRGVADGLAPMVRGVGLPTVIAVALASSVAEELLFRGVLLPWLGLGASSALFALAHAPPTRAMWAWPVFALAMGGLLGALTLWTGDLGAAVGVHFSTNLINLHWLANRGARPS